MKTLNYYSGQTNHFYQSKQGSEEHSFGPEASLSHVEASAAHSVTFWANLC